MKYVIFVVVLGCSGSASSAQFRNQTLSVFESLLTVRIEEHRCEADSVMMVHSETEDILVYNREENVTNRICTQARQC